MTARPCTPVTFEAADQLLVRADFYPVRDARATLVLCHRSHFNRGEYAEIAPALQALGFACLALDQRSGMNVLGYVNETSMRAKALELPTGYLAARPDIEAALRYAKKRSAERPLVLVGSSYSAALALLIACDSRAVTAVAAFSPGEHLKGVAVGDALTELAVPVFVTAARKEISEAKRVVREVPPALVTLYVPRKDGAHGARCLWQKTPGSDACRAAFVAFLEAVTSGATKKRGGRALRGAS